MLFWGQSKYALFLFQWSDGHLKFDTVTVTIIYSPKSLEQMTIYYLAQNNMMVFNTIFVLNFWFDNKFLDKVISPNFINDWNQLVTWVWHCLFWQLVIAQKRGKVVQILACYLAILWEFFSEYLFEAFVFDLFQFGVYPLLLCVKIEKWYFTSKILLIYCEKNCFSNLEELFQKIWDH